jgi:hypothetical protein
MISIAARHLQHVRAIISAVHAVASSTGKARRLGNQPARATTMRRGYWNGIHASSDNFGPAGDPGDLVGGDGVDRYEERTFG